MWFSRNRARPRSPLGRVGTRSELHTNDQLAQAQHEVRGLIGELITDAASAGTIRTDISPEELAGYCVHALEAARHTPSEEAVTRLILLTDARTRA